MAIVVLVLDVALCGCSSPDKEYRNIRKEIDREEFDSALAHVDWALAEYHACGDECIWRFRILKARILVSRNQSSETLAVLAKDLPPALSTTDIAEQRRLYQGIAHRYAQQFPLAEKDFDQAAEIVGALAPTFKYQLLVAKADLQVDEKKYIDAEANYRKALAMARQEKLPFSFEMNALGSLGRLATSQEHFDEAVNLNQSALRLSRSLGMQSSVATILGNTAWSYFQLGDFDNALEFYKEGADASERNGLASNTAYWFTGIANTYMALHDYASAEALSRQTLERARSMNNAQTITECLNTLAEITFRTSRPDEAEKYNQEAIELEEKGLDHFGVLESILLSGRIETRRRHFTEAEKLFRRVSQDPKAETPLKWEVQARLAELHDAENLPKKAAEEYRKCIDTIEAARKSIERDDLRLGYLSGGIEFYDDYVDFLIRHKRPVDALQVAELSRARTLAEGLSAGAKSPTRPSLSVRPEQVAARLRATILFYWLGQERSYLWVINPARTTYFTLPKALEIGPVGKSYRKILPEMRDVQDKGNADGKRLYAMLVEPAKKLIPKGSRVILLPDPSLSALNFETLIVPDPQPHFWIEDVTLTTASSLTLLASSTARSPSKGKGLLLVGNTEPVDPFPALSQAPDEMKRVAHYFPEAQRAVLEGKRATPTAYLTSDPGRFAYLHFVTHGTASVTRPLESAVILSKEGDSYKLYARDIVKHPLTAQLVTISACEGASGRAYSGEGLVGLSWAFLRAGAHNVIGALWEVSDSAAPQLMDKLYGELSRGQDPASALRAAKLSLLHSDNVYKKPYYWAPFQLYAGS